jgi:hypothetical protein
MHRFGIVVALALGVSGTAALYSGAALANSAAPSAFGPVLAIDNRMDHRSLLPQLTWNPECPVASQFMSVWEGKPAGQDWEVIRRSTDGTGTVLGGGPTDVTGEMHTQLVPSIAYNSAAGAPAASFMVVWATEESLVTWDIHAVVLSCTGVPLSAEVTIDSGLSDINPDVACGEITCWIVYEQVTSATTWQARAQAISGTGILGGGVALSAGSPNAKAVSIDANLVNGCAADSFLAVWQDRRAGTWDVLSQELDSVGACAAVTATAGGGGDQLAPDVAFGTADGVHQVVWHDGAGNVYGRIANADGTPAAARVGISIGASQQARAAVAYDDVANRFLTVWQDRRVGNWDIFGQLTTGMGALNGANFQFPSNARQAQNPAVAFSHDSVHFYVNWDRDMDDIFGVAYF